MTRAAIVFNIIIDKPVDLDKAADAVNEIHRLLVIKFGMDEATSQIKVSYSILSQNETQAGEVKL